MIRKNFLHSDIAMYDGITLSCPVGAKVLEEELA
jgi:hypothetical protein